MTFLERFDFALNPIAVKELRQAVRGRFIVSVLVLSLLAQALALGGIMIGRQLDLSDMVSGPRSFVMLFTVLVTACLLFVPIYSGARMAIERSDTNVDLIFITTIKPRTIIAGKMQAVLVIVALVFSASLPFLVFSYVLRGIDFISILVLLAAAYLVIATQAVIALFVGCLPVTKPFKGLLALVMLLVTLMVYGPMLAVMTESILRTGVALTTWDFWSAALAITVSFLGFDAILIVLSTAMIAPPAANRALAIRTLFSVLWAITFGTALWAAIEANSLDILTAWAVAQCVFITLVMLSAIGEREEWGPRIARTIPERPLRRAVAFLFFSGAAGGILWTLLFFGLTLLAFYEAAWVLPSATLRNHRDVLTSLAESVLCIVGYTMTALLIRRTLLANRVQPRMTWTLALLLLVLLAVVPPIVFFAMFAETDTFLTNFMYATIANPFPMLGSARTADVRLPFASAWAMLATLTNLGWGLAQWHRFRRRVAAVRTETAAVALQEVATEQ